MHQSYYSLFISPSSDLDSVGNYLENASLTTTIYTSSINYSLKSKIFQDVIKAVKQLQESDGLKSI